MTVSIEAVILRQQNAMWMQDKGACGTNCQLRHGCIHHRGLAHDGSGWAGVAGGAAAGDRLQDLAPAPGGQLLPQERLARGHWRPATWRSGALLAVPLSLRCTFPATAGLLSTAEHCRVYVRVLPETAPALRLHQTHQVTCNCGQSQGEAMKRAPRRGGTLHFLKCR